MDSFYFTRQRSIHRRLTSARKVLRRMTVIPRAERAIIDGNCERITTLLDRLEEML